MKSIRPLATVAAVLVFGICVYVFLLGNEVFDGHFKNDPFAWYFLAKGIFCAVSLIASSRILDTLLERLAPPKN
ncbi:MAG: hypothetical protein HY301_08720 [Verrucomicrobia bacterium]|nr:hypothetical protein [Verrucomicrobiota bacterium]